MARGSRVDYSDRDLSGIPVGDVLAAFQFPNLEAFFDPGQIVLEPVSHQHRLAVRAFDQVFQGIKFPVVKAQHVLVLGVNRSVCQLAQLAGQGGCVGGVHLNTLKLKDELLHHGFVIVVLAFAKGYRHGVHHALRQLKVVRASHGDRYIPNATVDLSLCARLRSVREHLHAIASVGCEERIPEVCNVASEAFTHVQQPELCPQIHQTVAGRRAGQADEAFDLRSHFEEAFETLCLVALE